MAVSGHLSPWEHNPSVPIIATPSRRRVAMGVLLVLAVVGGVIRIYAPHPSTLRDIGTLLLVLWLPAIGNFVAYLVTKIPSRKSQPAAFAPGSPFCAHLLAHIDTEPLPAGWIEMLNPKEARCTMVIGHRGFTVRSDAPLSQWLVDAPQALALECLVPSAALRELVPGTAFDLSVGPIVVARGLLDEVTTCKS
jgi:hypothetical protein